MVAVPLVSFGCKLAASRRRALRCAAVGSAWAAWLLVAGVGCGDDAPPRALRFRKITLSESFHAESAALGDLDRDGSTDVVVGPYWYAGPAFQRRYPIYPAVDFDPFAYSNNFMTEVADVDGDGWLDVLVNQWPGEAVSWFRNPGAGGVHAAAPWPRHLVHPAVDNESPALWPLAGVGAGAALLFHTGGAVGVAVPGPSPSTEPWTFCPLSAREGLGQYTHGLGAGDVNGDGRPDVLMASAWWEQPVDAQPGVGCTPALWRKHPQTFGAGGAQMHAYDVDGDGDGDVITSLAAHGHGLSWFEQTQEDGALAFVEHPILPAQPEASLDGVQFSQLHALALVDVDGDGLKDLVTGKRFWAHGPHGDADPSGAPVLYWFQLTRSGAGAGGVRYLPHLIDDASGVGTQLAVGDVSGDGRPDVVIGNKRGAFVFVQLAPR